VTLGSSPGRESWGHGEEGVIYFVAYVFRLYEKLPGIGSGFRHLLVPVGGRAYGTRENRWHFTSPEFEPDIVVP
jgi:hypothetical protein